MASASSTTIESQLEAFGTRFFSTVSQNNPGENIFLSPASVALAMSMCTVGAREQTLQEMLRVLQVSTVEQLQQSANDVMEIFSTAANDKKVILRLANRLYAQKAYKLRNDYLKVVQNSFKADIQLADFVQEGASVVRTINSWVEEQTNNLIRNLLSPQDINADTRLIIVNCIYFKGTWEKQFDENNTDRSANFYEANGKVSKTSLMYLKHKFAYAFNQQLRVQIADLPYKSDKMSTKFVFTVILPEKDVSLDVVEQKLNSQPELMSKVLTERQNNNQEMFMYLPKFKIETTFNLNNVLQQMGISQAFDKNSANFTGIVSPQDDGEGLYISKVIHKAFIDVNEMGSEAAGATATLLTRKKN